MRHLRAPTTTKRRLAAFAGAVDVVTYEFENVPAKTALRFSPGANRCCPDPQVLETTQDRLTEKNFISALGIATAPYRAGRQRDAACRGGSQRSAARPCSRRAGSAMTARARR